MLDKLLFQIVEPYVSHTVDKVRQDACAVPMDYFSI